MPIPSLNLGSTPRKTNLRPSIESSMIEIYFILVFSCLSVQINAQNLLSNGDFEQLAISYSSAVVKDWVFERVGYNCNNDNTNFNHSTFPYKGNRCDPSSFPYLSGNTKMTFDAVAFKDMENSGSGYMYQKLKKKLEIGKLLKVQIHYYFPKVFLVDSALYMHLGFTLLRDKPTVPASFYKWSLTNDSLVFDRWFCKTWYIRPICDFDYFLIGISYNDQWPTAKLEDRYGSQYFVDDVSMTIVDEKEEIEQKIVGRPFCNNQEPAPKPTSQTFDSLLIYFNSNSAALFDSAKLALDTFANFAKKNKNFVFEIDGFTDDVGTNHLELARSRVDAAIAYLNTNHQIEVSRFIPKYRGNMGSSNGSAATRSLNRKVRIRKSEMKLDQVYYQKVLSTASSDSAFLLLKKWLDLAPQNTKIYALFDPRLDKLKKANKWSQFVNDVKKVYQNFKKPSHSFLLDSLCLADQKYRTIEYEIQELASPYCFQCNDNFKFPPITTDELKLQDSFNFVGLQKFIEQHGWPKQSEVGERPSKAAFYIVDHSVDTQTMQKYLPILEARCREGEANWLDYATMFDRLEVVRGQPQKFCTQFAMDPTVPNRYILAPYDSKAAVNERRKQLGLNPVQNFDASFMMKNH